MDPDYAIQSTISVILTRLVQIPIPGVYEAVVKVALPHLCHAIMTAEGDDLGMAGAGLEQVSALLQGAPNGSLGPGFVDALAPCLFRTMEDRNAIQVRSLLLVNACICLTCDDSGASPHSVSSSART